MPDFVEDPAFWGVTVAVLAVALSQLPPLRQMIKGAKLTLLVPESFMLNHSLGNLNLTIWVDILNEGGRTVRIRRIDCLLVEQDESKCISVPAVTYWRNLGTSQTTVEFPIGAIVLKPEEHWAESLHCYRAWTDREEEEVAGIRLGIQSSIGAKIQPGQNAPQEADPALVQRATDFFERKFPLGKGQYRLVIALLEEEGRPLRVNAYAFTLYESHIRAMRSAVEAYKFGAGVYFASTDTTPNVWPRLRPLAEGEARDTYARALRQFGMVTPSRWACL